MGENRRIKLDTVGWARWRYREIGVGMGPGGRLRGAWGNYIYKWQISKTKDLKIARFIRELPEGSSFFHCLFGKNRCRLALVAVHHCNAITSIYRLSVDVDTQNVLLLNGQEKGLSSLEISNTHSRIVWKISPLIVNYIQLRSVVTVPMKHLFNVLNEAVFLYSYLCAYRIVFLN